MARARPSFPMKAPTNRVLPLARVVAALALWFLRRFLSGNIFDADDVQNGTPSSLQREAFGIRIESNLDCIPENPCAIVIADVVSLTVGHFESEWTERPFFQAFFDLEGCEHSLAFAKESRNSAIPVKQLCFRLAAPALNSSNGSGCRPSAPREPFPPFPESPFRITSIVTSRHDLGPPASYSLAPSFVKSRIG